MARYDEIGVGYTLGRRTDSRWLAPVLAALGSAASVLDVGSGTGSYEPPSRRVVAVEPSAEMIRQRAPEAAPVVRAVAEALPFASGTFDAALAVLTVHHWGDWRGGLTELRRVSGRQVVLAYDTALHNDFWLVREYVPEVAVLESSRPSAPEIADFLGAASVVPLPVPWDFTDGVFPAYWRRPEAYLDPAVRRSCSALAQTAPAAVSRGMARLAADLESGRWHEEHRELLELPEWDAGFRLIVA
ncbi:class I SAM-dependent methyltransferase [Amycolatopsis rifamycinica]|uniref:MerR family transcriptional regulator n=1 Tax=Amycolatopsis rifamycinica TaxID=287986 RepID=A0A066UGH5_9PSEU|nr:class I SAM-dependent methyltransferase [Amycolatopsis rifamycinica]KDN23244.1 MerR family transcriptional regulator [Amycolatopsis rifamycinica]